MAGTAGRGSGLGVGSGLLCSFVTGRVRSSFLRELKFVDHVLAQRDRRGGFFFQSCEIHYSNCR